MTTEILTNLLAERILGWVAAPDRFLKGDRGWLPRWRFAPLANVDHAFMLLDKAAGAYTLSADKDGVFHAEVLIGDAVGKASGESKARVIALALASALGIDVEGIVYDK